MYVEDVEDGKRTYHTFWLITSLILNGFSNEKSFGKLRLRAFQPYHQILCMSKHVKDVEDRSNTHKGLYSKTIQWHIHAGSWSLVNCWREGSTLPYKGCS